MGALGGPAHVQYVLHGLTAACARVCACACARTACSLYSYLSGSIASARSLSDVRVCVCARSLPT